MSSSTHAGPKIGREWPIRYRGSHEERVEQLRALGVRRFSALPYAHRPGIATYLNDWARDFAAEVPECLWSATFYPEPERRRRTSRELVAAGVEVFKVHVQVGELRPRRPAARRRSGADRGRRHARRHARRLRTGRATTFTGPEPLRGVLERHPRLTAVVAHLGAPEYAEFLALAEAYERVRLDTTMVFTDFFEAEAPYPRDLLPRLARPRRPGAARQRLPDHPLPVRPPARGPRAARARRGLAARGVLEQRSSAVRLTNRRSSACARGRGWSTFTPVVCPRNTGHIRAC